MSGIPENDQSFELLRKVKRMCGSDNGLLEEVTYKFNENGVTGEKLSRERMWVLLSKDRSLLTQLETLLIGNL